MFLPLFNEAKTAQAVAYLLDRAGGSMELLKLIKLMYLTERRSYEEYGEPLTGDLAYSLEHGPVLSKTLELAGAKAQPSGVWAQFVAQRSGNDISLADGVRATRDDLRALSPSDFEILDAIWTEFGAMSASQLRKYTHDHCPEYEDPTFEGKKQKHIKPVAFLQAIGFSEDQAHAYLRELLASARARKAFNQLA